MIACNRDEHEQLSSVHASTGMIAAILLVGVWFYASEIEHGPSLDMYYCCASAPRPLIVIPHIRLREKRKQRDDSFASSQLSFQAILLGVSLMLICATHSVSVLVLF